MVGAQPYPMNSRTPSLTDLVGLASRWVQVLAPVAGPLTAGEDLAKLAGRLALDASSGLDDTGQAAHAGQLIGRQLAEANLTSPEAVSRAVVALGDHWRQAAPPEPACVTAMQGGIAAGHARTVQQLLLTQQEAIHRATVAARSSAQDRLRYEAAHDRLTGLANRAHFLHLLDEALTGYQDNSDGRILLCLLDLSGFATVNLVYGHRGGDRVLRSVAERLSTAVDGTATLLARFGGDEFAVLQHGPATGTGAGLATSPIELATRLLSTLDPPIPLGGTREVQIVAHAGCVELVIGQTTLDDALHSADLALRARKSSVAARSTSTRLACSPRE
jgi:diguanylate cyclase (GGDEF)-like protein